MTQAKLQTIAVANLKGGVGKTTTAVCLASGLALNDRPTLLIDLDWQLSATAHFLDPKSLRSSGTIYDVLDGRAALLEAAVPTHIGGLSLVPPGDDKRRYDRGSWAPGGTADEEEMALRWAVSKMAGAKFRYIVIDTSPSIDLLTVNALAAADWVLVPVTCEYLPLLGLKRFNQMLALIKARLGAGPKVLGYLLTMVDRREKITWEVEHVLKSTFGSLLFRTQIRIDTKIKACPSHRKTVYEFEPENGRARTDYESLVREVIERLESSYELGGR